MLIVYGEFAYRACLTGSLYRFSKVGLPSASDGAREDGELVPLLAKLRSRAVVIWPEPGNEGRQLAMRHAALIGELGAVAVGIVTLPENWPDDFQLGDKLPESITPSDIVALVNATLRDATALALPIHNAGQLKRTRAIVPALAPVDGAQLFARLTAFLAARLSEPQTTIDTIALWSMHAWAHDAVDVSPRLVLHGQDPRADHARALRLAAWLTPAPLVVSRTIAAHLLPVIAADRPTLLLDDVGGTMLGYIDMRALIIAGSSRDGAFLGARTKKNPTGWSPCFAPTALATTARLPDDLRARSIVVPMSTPANNAREALALSDPPFEVLRLRADMQRWAKPGSALPGGAGIPPTPRGFGGLARASAAAIAFSDGGLPALGKRAGWTPALPGETWSPLIAIASALGAEAAGAAATALKVLSPPARHLSSDHELLDDVRELLGTVDADTPVPTLELLEKLVADPERAWATAHSGRKLTARGLAERLDRFGLRPRIMRTPTNKVLRGYDGQELTDAFTRYLGDAEPGSIVSSPAVAGEVRERSESGGGKW